MLRRNFRGNSPLVNLYFNHCATGISTNLYLNVEVVKLLKIRVAQQHYYETMVSHYQLLGISFCQYPNPFWLLVLGTAPCRNSCFEFNSISSSPATITLPTLPGVRFLVRRGHQHGERNFLRLVIKLAVTPPEIIGFAPLLEAFLVVNPQCKRRVSRFSVVEGQAWHTYMSLARSALPLLLLLWHCGRPRVPAGQALDPVGAARAAAVSLASSCADKASVAGAWSGPGIPAEY